MSIKCSQFARLASIDKMSSKAIVFFALLTVAFAGPTGIQKPHLGFRLPQFSQFSPQVVGGDEAPANEYPFIASLQAYGSQHYCAGIILDENWIMTAAHCIDANYPTTCKVGKHNIQKSEDTEQAVEIEKTFMHEQYGGGVGPYDIGLIKLKTPLKFTNEVQPIKLPKPESDPVGDAILAGWGYITGGSMPDKLQHVDLEYVDRATCHKAVEDLTGSSPVHETNVCTGPMSGGISACNGDSGGPLFEKQGDNYVITGIVSWGIIPCGTVGAPSVYTRVSSFNDWIESITNNN
ncbi:mite allergen Der f 3-like [Nylanderia fulva]|uniref:mite allergen Der f 3-like n=1 Tax=Nylanderia fulva TaxID=613905 RepID=UPI0010FAFA9D|nr:mite allergen Der f 3-like [Nylanderia fulva]